MSQENKRHGWFGVLLEFVVVAVAGTVQAIFGPADKTPFSETDHAVPPSGVLVESEIEPPAVWPHRDGWSAAKPEDLPAPTYTPAMMAFGIVLLALGLITRWYVSAVGACAFMISVWQWIGELRHD